MYLAKLENILLFLVILFLPTQLGRHFWPQFSYIYSLKIDYLSPTIYFWDLLVVLLLLVWIIKKTKVNLLALNLFLFFILTQLISLLDDTFNLGAGLTRIEQYLIVGLFGVYLGSITLNQVKSVVFWALGISVGIESLLAAAQFIKGGTLGFWILGERTFTISTPGIAKFNFYGMEFLRPYATFPHPNILAAFLIITIPLLLLFKLKNGGMFMIWSSVLGGMVLLLTVSRVALLAGFLEALFLLKKKVLAWMLLALIFISPFIYTRFSTLFNFDSLSFIRREELLEVALNLWVQSPVFGVGLNNFIPSASDQLLAGPSRFLQPVHNIFLLTLSETGILGLLGLLGLLGYPIYKLVKVQNSKCKVQMLMVWGIIIFLGLFDHYFLTLPQGYRLLFLVWGISWFVLELKNAKS